MESSEALIYVVDRQNLDGSWTGVASIWDDVSPDLLGAILDSFALQDQSRQYRLVQKVRNFTEHSTVIS